MNEYKYLFQPLRIKDTIFKNRIFFAPTLNCQISPDGRPTDYLLDYFSARAAGGAAAVTVGDTPVDSSYAPIKQLHLVVDDPASLPMMAELALNIRCHGCIASLEINHGGNFASPLHISGKYRIGPVDKRQPDGTFVKKMDDKLIAYTTESFARAAAFVKMAGFNMVTIHAGHGWLLHQFLSPLSNTRTDRYGGTAARRATFPLEVLAAVRSMVGNDFLIELRINGEDYIDGSMRISDAIEFAKQAERYVDIIHVSSSIDTNTPSAAIVHPSAYLPHCCNAELAAAVKRAVHVPVAVVGAVMNAAEADQLIADGKADIVAMGRALIADPDLPNKSRRGLAADVRPCIRCLNCLEEQGIRRSFNCTVNPAAGREHAVARAIPLIHTDSRHIAVVGAGPAGLAAALAAAGSQKRVTLFEKEEVLGGMLARIEGMKYKDDLERYRQWLCRQVDASAHIEVIKGGAALPRLVADLHADAVIVAIGSEPNIPRLPGFQKYRPIDAADVCLREKQIGQKVAVIGGGLSALDIAIHLAAKGHGVTVVGRSLRARADSKMNAEAALGILRQLGVQLLLSHTAEALEKNGVRVKFPSGEMGFLPADTVVLATGRQSTLDAANAFRPTAADFSFIGDCIRPGRLRGAIHAGYFAGLYI